MAAADAALTANDRSIMMAQTTRAQNVVLFTDVHDFSLAWRELGERQVEFLQEMYARLGEVVVAAGGELLKYMGDGMLALFPAGSERAAVLAAITLRQVYAELARAYGLADETELEVGLAAGEVVVGTFGHESLMMKDAFGEAVNEAATIGHHRGIAVSASFYDAVKGAFQARPLPDVRVKWRREPLRVWKIREGQTFH